LRFCSSVLPPVNCDFEQADAFGPEFTIGFDLMRVVENIFDTWMQGG
jgi:hypothetical protein